MLSSLASSAGFSGVAAAELGFPKPKESGEGFEGANAANGEAGGLFWSLFPMAAKGDVDGLFSSLAGALNFAKPDVLGSEGLPKAGCEPGDEVAQTGDLFPNPLDDPKVALPLVPPRAEPKTWPLGGVEIVGELAG